MVQLASVPVLVDSLALSVDGSVWQRVDDLLTAAPEVPLAEGSSPVLADPVELVDVYTVDRESGVVRFGDGVHGRRPPLGALISASYDHGGGGPGWCGRRHHQGPGAAGRRQGVQPVPTWGGSEAESVEAAEQQMAGFVRHRDRLVTAADFADVVARTPGIDLGRVEVLPLYQPTLGDRASAGVVTLLLVPRYDNLHPETPEPDRFFLDAVCAHLDPRRLVTTELHLRGPEYVPVCVRSATRCWPAGTSRSCARR